VLGTLLELVSASPWTYAAILAVAALDVVLPIVPSEATVISAGVLAGTGDLNIFLVVAAGAAGAFAGDSGAYGLGRLLGPRVEARIAARPKAAGWRAWAERTLERHGGGVIVLARFVPGGRSAATLTAGLVRMPPARFLLFAAAAGLAWASFAGLLGYAGGRTFEDHPHGALVVAFGAAAALVALVEGVRRWRRWRTGDDAGSSTRDGA
jgi:membrane protein DedA with SNARE-associated domain